MKLRFVNHSLYVALLGAAGLLSGCSVFEDLEPCRNNAQIRLRYTRNMAGSDRYASDVHCARVLIYDAAGNYVSTFTPEGAAVDIPLLEGDYHAIAFGGMHCEESSFGYNLDAAQSHNYFNLVSELRNSRAAATESASALHSHFQSFADFHMQNLEGAHVPVEIDLTKNTNHISLEMACKGGVPIAAGAYTATITADNAVISHDGKIVKQSAPVIYRPFSTGYGPLSLTENKNIACISQEFDLSIIDDQDAPVLRIYDAKGVLVYTHSLMPLFEKAKQHELPDVGMREYLDRQDNWLIQITDIESGNGFTKVSLFINGWQVVNNKFEL